MKTVFWHTHSLVVTLHSVLFFVALSNQNVPSVILHIHTVILRMYICNTKWGESQSSYMPSSYPAHPHPYTVLHMHTCIHTHIYIHTHTHTKSEASLNAPMRPPGSAAGWGQQLQPERSLQVNSANTYVHAHIHTHEAKRSLQIRLHTHTHTHTYVHYIHAALHA